MHIDSFMHTIRNLSTSHKKFQVDTCSCLHNNL